MLLEVLPELNVIENAEKPADEAEACRQLEAATNAKKCWTCGCFHSSVEAIGEAFPTDSRPEELASVLAEAKSTFLPQKYDCLGCPVCWPSNAVNALKVEGDACPTETPEEREGWPRLAGDYTVLRYSAPVAVCTLTDKVLWEQITGLGNEHLSIVGTMFTENLGIERLITNMIANPNIRHLILTGSDSEQAIGHLPGQSLFALAEHGLDERNRIIGARGKRPLLKNLNLNAVEHFRRNIHVVNLIGSTDLSEIQEAIQIASEMELSPAIPFYEEANVGIVKGYIPNKMISDPNGYFVIYPDFKRRLVSLEHYNNTGVLNKIIEGHSSAELYIPVVEMGLISRLDHAAYLGRELARAEQSLRSGEPFVQDAAPEKANANFFNEPQVTLSNGCGCTTCEEEKNQ